MQIDIHEVNEIIESANRLRDHASPPIISITDSKGVIIYINDGFCNISKYTSDELIGQRHSFINSGHHSREFFREMWATISAGNIWKGEIRNRAKDGSLYWVDSIIVPVCGTDGKPYRYVSMRKNISSHKDIVEKKYRILFDQSKDGLITSNPNGSLWDVNNAVCSMLGYSRQELMQLNRWDILVMDEPYIRENQNNNELRKNFNHILRLRRRDGTQIEVEIYTATYTDENGKQLTTTILRDITEKRKADMAIMMNEHRLRSLMEHSKDVITILHTDGSILYRSLSYREVMGYDMNEEMTGSMFDNIHPDDQDNMKKNFRHVFEQNGASCTNVWRQQHKDGSWRWVQGTGTNMIDDPALGGIVCNYRDITMYVESQEKIQQINEEMNYLFNSVDEVLYSTEHLPAKKMLLMSAACAKVYGYRSQEFFDNVDLWYDVIVDEDKHKIKEMYSTWLQGHVGKLQYRINHKDGSIRWIEALVTPTLDKEGRIARIDGVNRDITEKILAEEKLRKSERVFKSLIENSKDVVMLTDKDRIFKYVSPAILDLLGYTPEELIGKWAYAFVHPDDKPTTYQVMRPVREEGYASAFQTLRVQHKDGSWRWIEARASNYLDDPSISSVVINFRDVTERKIAEDALAELNRSLENKVSERTEQLRDSNAALESFAYMAAHDLQAPLRVMSGYATILSKAIQSSGNEDNISLLKGISDSSKKMSVLINDLLCFSRISHSVLQKEELDLNVIVSEEIDALMLTNMNYLDTEIRLYGLGSCYCDQQMARQVWQNLLSNAMKYSHKVEKPMVEIGYTMSGEEKVYYVRDNGAGFEQKNADKIFQAFKRLHSSDDFEGTGIGLATVRNIIERHGGKVWAASEQGLGATFYFTLPV